MIINFHYINYFTSLIIIFSMTQYKLLSLKWAIFNFIIITLIFLAIITKIQY